MVLALHDAVDFVTGRAPTNATVALLWAQWALETGRGHAMHCDNVGNIKAASDYAGLYCQFRCNEVIHGKLEWFTPPNPATNFRAYSALVDGACDYVEFLATRPRYAYAWAKALTGEPAAFVHALKIAGYFTAAEGPYRAAIESLFRDEEATIEHVVFEPDPHYVPLNPDPEHSTLTYEDLVARALELRIPWGELTDDDRERAREERDEDVADVE